MVWLGIYKIIGCWLYLSLAIDNDKMDIDLLNTGKEILYNNNKNYPSHHSSGTAINNSSSSSAKCSGNLIGKPSIENATTAPVTGSNNSNSSTVIKVELGGNNEGIGNDRQQLPASVINHTNFAESTTLSSKSAMLMSSSSSSLAIGNLLTTAVTSTNNSTTTINSMQHPSGGVGSTMMVMHPANNSGVLITEKKSIDSNGGDGDISMKTANLVGEQHNSNNRIMLMITSLSAASSSSTTLTTTTTPTALALSSTSGNNNNNHHTTTILPSTTQIKNLSVATVMTGSNNNSTDNTSKLNPTILTSTNIKTLKNDCKMEIGTINNMNNSTNNNRILTGKSTIPLSTSSGTATASTSLSSLSLLNTAGVNPSNIKVEIKTESNEEDLSSNNNSNIFLPPHAISKHLDEMYTIFFGNNNWYLFFRLHAILCERLQTMYEKAHALAVEEEAHRRNRRENVARALRLKPKNEVPVEDYYPTFIDMLKSVLDGNMDSNTFEDSMREMFGIHAYLSFTLDKVVSNAVRQLQNCVTEKAALECVELFHNEQKYGTSVNLCSRASNNIAAERAYQKKAEELLHDENCFRIYIVSKYIYFNNAII